MTCGYYIIPNELFNAFVAAITEGKVGSIHIDNIFSKITSCPTKPVLFSGYANGFYFSVYGYRAIQPNAVICGAVFSINSYETINIVAVITPDDNVYINTILLGRNIESGRTT